MDELLYLNTEATASKTSAPSNSQADPSSDCQTDYTDPRVCLYRCVCVIIRCTVSTCLFRQDAL